MLNCKTSWNPSQQTDQTLFTCLDNTFKWKPLGAQPSKHEGHKGQWKRVTKLSIGCKQSVFQANKGSDIISISCSGKKRLHKQKHSKWQESYIQGVLVNQDCNTSGDIHTCNSSNAKQWLRSSQWPLRLKTVNFRSSFFRFSATGWTICNPKSGMAHRPDSDVRCCGKLMDAAMPLFSSLRSPKCPVPSSLRKGTLLKTPARSDISMSPTFRDTNDLHLPTRNAKSLTEAVSKPGTAKSSDSRTELFWAKACNHSPPSSKTSLSSRLSTLKDLQTHRDIKHEIFR